MANATNLTTQPPVNLLSKSCGGMGPGYIVVGTEIWMNLVFNGAPTAEQGAGWAGKGSSGVDETTGKWYSNRGTAASPNWTEFNNA